MQLENVIEVDRDTKQVTQDPENCKIACDHKDRILNRLDSILSNPDYKCNEQGCMISSPCIVNNQTCNFEIILNN